MSKRTAAAVKASKKRQITLERTYQASPKDVWDLWTTRDGIESWWGPEGFAVRVRKLDLRPGGELRYAMTAVGPDQVEFMKHAGMPLTTEARLTYDAIAPRAVMGWEMELGKLDKIIGGATAAR
jgi:uncharacterized protein YndB with AHSA1/START domain